MNEIQTIAERYREAGWEVPLPLPHGAKFPPAEGTTGGLLREEASAKAERSWEGRSKANIALRAQIADPAWDIMSLDIDQYDDKTGMESYLEMAAELGELDLQGTLRSTRRGKDSPSAQYFFRVPRGLKLRAQASDSIEIVQLVHRYSVVWPSVKDGAMYHWYLGDQELEIPSPSDALVLPTAWVQALTSGEVRLRRPSEGKFVVARKEEGPTRAAFRWLRDNIPGFGTEDEMSPGMKRAVDLDNIGSGMAADAHDTMLRAVRRVVRSAAEGQGGLKIALLKIQDAFVEETTNRTGEGRRTESHAKREFGRALADEIQKLTEDIQSGAKRIRTTPLTDAVVTSWKTTPAEEAPDNDDKEQAPVFSGRLDFDPYDSDFQDNDEGSAALFTDYWGQVVLVTGDSADKEFAVWDAASGRYRFRGQSQMYGYLKEGCSRRLLHEADKLVGQAENLAAVAETGQLPAGSQDPEELEQKAGQLRKRARDLGNTTKANNVLRQLHSVEAIDCPAEEFDAQPGLIGLGNRMTLDTRRIGTPDEIRLSRPDDRLSFSTETVYEEGATHPAWDLFLDQVLPDLELRAYVQKVLGYSLFDGNPSKILVFLVGPSNTGKTTILEACAAALGDYATSANAHQLFSGGNSGPNPELVNNSQKLMVYLSEVGSSNVLSADSIKRVTGGDRIQARTLYSRNTISRSVRFTPYISTNTPPRITAADAALKNRVIALPFNNVSPGLPSPQMNVRDNLAVRPAILAWLIEGARRVYAEGLSNQPEASVELGREFMDGTSLVGEFLADKVEIHKDRSAAVDGATLFREWQTWGLKMAVDRRDVGDQPTFEKDLRAQLKRDETYWRTTRNGKKTYIYGCRITE